MTQVAEPETPSPEAQPPDRELPAHVRIAIVGAGFSGLALAMRLLEEGIDDFVVLERDEDVGGTWRDNTYPGCACDVPSHLYSWSFELNPDWSRTYSRQPEIREYIRRCTEKRGVMPYIHFGHDLRDARWINAEGRWQIETSRGRLTSQILVAAMGPMSAPSWPDIPGLDSFEGTIFHSGRWNHDHDVTGERVAAIGTGASAIQFVPKIQPDAARVKVFQRTAPWVLPRTDRTTTRFERRLYRRFPALQKIARSLIYWRQELLVPGLVIEPRILKVLEWAARAHLRKSVSDPALRERLTPNFRLGCKRILVSSDWYPALGQDNVDVVTEGIREVRPHAIVTEDGTEYDVDTIILGTGFSVTDMMGAERVHGRDGRSLSELWQGSPQAYLGTTIAGYPNLFFLVGPNLGPGHTSVVFYAESQVAYVLDALRRLDEAGVSAFDVRRDVQEAYNGALQERMRGSVWTDGGCNSWYIDKMGKNTTLWPGFSWELRLRTRRFKVADYRLERLSAKAPAPNGPAQNGAVPARSEGGDGLRPSPPAPELTTR
jgi:cation diffusion facilitator CzcD-associated flavoprotein CzcO